MHSLREFDYLYMREEGGREREVIPVVYKVSTHKSFMGVEMNWIFACDIPPFQCVMPDRSNRLFGDNIRAYNDSISKFCDNLEYKRNEDGQELSDFSADPWRGSVGGRIANSREEATNPIEVDSGKERE